MRNLPPALHPCQPVAWPTSRGAAAWVWAGWLPAVASLGWSFASGGTVASLPLPLKRDFRGFLGVSGGKGAHLDSSPILGVFGSSWKITIFETLACAFAEAFMESFALQRKELGESIGYPACGCSSEGTPSGWFTSLSSWPVCASCKVRGNSARTIALRRKPDAYDGRAVKFGPFRQKIPRASTHRTTSRPCDSATPRPPPFVATLKACHPDLSPAALTYAFP